MSKLARAVVAAAIGLALTPVTGCGLLELGEPVDPEPEAVLPADWPAEFPDPPPGAALARVTHLEPDANPGMFAHLPPAEIVNYYEVVYDIDEEDMVILFNYYDQAFRASGWHDLQIADDPNTLVTSHTGFTFQGFGVRGHLSLFTGFDPSGITVDMQILQ
jgi:hypothetical protein